MKVTYEIENGKMVKVMTDAYWVKKFDENGNESYFKDNDGYEEWYDSNGNMNHSRCNNGYEYWAEYDSKGKEIHTWDTDGYEWFCDDYEARKAC